MFPIRDNLPSRTFPVVNYTLIGLCAVAFLIQLSAGKLGDELVYRWGMVPVRVVHPNQQIQIPVERAVQTPLGIQYVRGTEILSSAAIPEWMTLFTCMFLHGGWLHFLGNMWFLHIFGDNVEDRVGHGLYILLYVGCGLVAGVAHMATNVNSTMPTIGASGAIAGVMGAYLILYPHARVLTVIPIFIIIQIFEIPAPIFLGVWFLIQFLYGSFSIGGAEAGGVAWWAHIGGFASGSAVALALLSLHKTSPPVEQLHLENRRYGFPQRRSRSQTSSWDDET